MIEITFDKEQFGRLERLLRGAPAKLVRAEKAAVTRSAKAGVRQIADKASALLSDHRKQTIRTRMVLASAGSSNRFRMDIRMPFRPIGLIHFGAAQNPSGITATVGDLSVSIPSAFIARGRGVKKAGRKVVFVRRPGARHVQHIGRSGNMTWSASKIRPVFGPTLAGLMEKGGISSDVYPFIAARLEKELDGQIGRFWRIHGK